MTLLFHMSVKQTILHYERVLNIRNCLMLSITKKETGKEKRLSIY